MYTGRLKVMITFELPVNNIKEEFDANTLAEAALVTKFSYENDIYPVADDLACAENIQYKVEVLEEAKTCRE